MANIYEAMFEQLAAPFPADTVKWFPGSTTKDKSRGMALAYIDARIVQRRLDAVLGPFGWSNDFAEVKGRVVCTIRVLNPDTKQWVSKADGAGDTAIEGEKGGLSDAFKRAAVQWGVGRYLYDLPAVWCELDQYGKLKSTPTLPAWAVPEGGGTQAPTEANEAPGKDAPIKDATPPQLNLIRSLGRSHLLADEEKATLEGRLKEGFDKHGASEQIERLKAILESRSKWEFTGIKV
jgi:hypothetical protein